MEESPSGESLCRFYLNWQGIKWLKMVRFPTSFIDSCIGGSSFFVSGHLFKGSYLAVREAQSDFAESWGSFRLTRLANNSQQCRNSGLLCVDSQLSSERNPTSKLKGSQVETSSWQNHNHCHTLAVATPSALLSYHEYPLAGNPH